jgi:DUF4097 and DUF4098 domain-containing protein YvlB
MTTYELTGPLLARVQSAVGEIDVATHDAARADVEVRALRDDDVTRETVEKTTVELRPRGDGHELVVDVPKRHTFLGREPRLRIELRVPHGTDLTFHTASAEVTANGRLGDVRGKTASGDVTVAAAATVELSTASGDLRADEVSGSADVKTASGDIRLGHVGGAVNAGVVSGDVRVDTAESGGTFSAVSGDIEVVAVAAGDVRVSSVSGDVEIGVPEGTGVHVDVSTVSGDLSSDVELDEVQSEGTAGPVVDIRGKTVSGDVRVRRVAAARR